MALTRLPCFTPHHRVPGLVPCFSAGDRAEAGEVGKNISLPPCHPLSCFFLPVFQEGIFASRAIPWSRSHLCYFQFKNGLDLQHSRKDFLLNSRGGR